MILFAFKCNLNSSKLNTLFLFLFFHICPCNVISDVVVFDNSYSYFKNKRIRYSVILTPPVDIETLEKGAERLECE